MKAFQEMEITATWNKQINLELVCLLRPVFNPDCSIVKCVYHKVCAETILHLGDDFP